MGELNATLAAETEALKEVYAAINRNDIPAAIKAFDPEIEWTEHHGYPKAGTIRGHAAVQAHLAKQRGNWAEGRCEPERFISADDKIVVLANVRVRLKNNTARIEGPVADVYTFQNGKAIALHSFAERRQALEWAGVNDSDAN